KRCLGPCVLPVDRAVYEEHLRQAMLLLEGRNRDVVSALRRRIGEAAAGERFEDAARLRDQLRAIEKTQEPQQVVEHWGANQDVFGLYREGGSIEVQVLFVRDGKLVSNQTYAFDDWEFPDAEVLEEVLTQFYQATERDVPDEILLPTPISDEEIRAEYLSERRGKKVAILVPQRGDKLRLVEMARENARQSFAERRDAGKQAARMAAELQQRLHLANAPKRIECVDIANIQGTLSVGSVVAFDEGMPAKAGYRHFRIRSVEGADDFASMAEVLQRRFRDAKERGDLPDLLVIDGGPGQLSAASAVVHDLGITELEVVALAKERVERDATACEIRRRPERVFLPGRKNPVVLKPNSSALFLLQRVRDEAHRFANTYHRKLRARARLASPLDQVAGIGPRRRRALLRRFGSVKRIGEATAGGRVAGVGTRCGGAGRAPHGWCPRPDLPARARGAAHPAAADDAGGSRGGRPGTARSPDRAPRRSRGARPRDGTAAGERPRAGRRSRPGPGLAIWRSPPRRHDPAHAAQLREPRPLRLRGAPRPPRRPRDRVRLERRGPRALAVCRERRPRSPGTLAGAARHRNRRRRRGARGARAAGAHRRRGGRGPRRAARRLQPARRAPHPRD